MNDCVNIQDNLLKSLKTLSSILATIFILIVVLCAYLIQRSAIILTSIPSLIFDGGIQVSLWGLEFSYRTLTILWPAVLGGICLSFYLLNSKRLFIVSRLTEHSQPLSVDLISTIDPLLITPKTCGLSDIPSLFKFAAILPFLTLCWHLSMTFVPFIGSFHIVRLKFLPNAIEFTFLILFTISACIFGFWGVLLFKRSLLKTISLDMSENAQKEKQETNHFA